MQGIGRCFALAILMMGLVGCGGGIKEGSPPADVGYVPPAPDDFVEELPASKKPRR